ncbi:MAG: fibronectin type III domain-containing protein, partial [Blastocatellia bacterium]|nr:fibronectin type III domain-containing protein [Blastocatellia bacterium]
MLVLLFLQLAVLGCGRVGDPLPPIRYSTLVPESVLAMQRGSELIITWPKPTQISLERSKIVRAEILRREESATDPKRLTEESFIDNAQIIGSLSVKDISEIEGKTVRFVDILDPENIDSSKRYRYAVRYVQFTGVSLPLSSYAFAEPITTVAKAPEELNVEVSQTTIKLSWKVPAENIDLTPANVSGYNIYRKTKNQAEELLSPTPVTITVFEDRKFKFETEYTYRIRIEYSNTSSCLETVNLYEHGQYTLNVQISTGNSSTDTGLKCL